MKKFLCCIFFALTSSYAQTIEWQSIGAGGGGWLSTMAISKEGVMLIGCDIGGVFRSTNYGESWQNVNGTLRDYTIDMVVFDNANPKIAYATMNGGIYKSVDAGETWQHKHNGFPPQQLFSYSMPISCISIDPTNNQFLYAGVGRARFDDKGSGKGIIYKSLNGGDSWFRVSNSSLPDTVLVYTIMVARTNHSLIFASTNSGVFKSIDGGVNWQTISGNLPNLQTRYLAVHHSNPDMIYVTLTSPAGVEPWQGGVWKTTDGGKTWQQHPNGLYVHVGGTFEPFEVTSNYRMLVMDDQNPDILYTGNFGWWTPTIYRSNDGGNSWQGLLDEATADKGWLPWGISVESIAVHSTNPNIIFFGTSGYVMRTLDGGKNWQQAYTNKIGNTWRSRGIEITLANRIVFDEQHPDTFYSGSYDIGCLRTTDGGNTFSPLWDAHGGFGTVWDIAVDPVRSNVIFTGAGEAFGNQGSVMRSTDWGATWTNINKQNTGLPNAQVTAIAIDKQSPQSKRIVYAGVVGYGIYKSEDDGVTWKKTNIEATQYFRVTKFVFSSKHSNRLYATIYRGANTNKNVGVSWTDNGGLSWQSTPFHTVEDIAIDPRLGDIYIARRESFDDQNGQFFKGGVFKSNDGGSTWTDEPIFYDMFASSVSISADGRYLFAATNDHPFHDNASGHGVWMSLDGGKTWSEMNHGLAFKAVNKLTCHPTNPNLIFAATQGNGVFKGTMSTSTSVRQFAKTDFDYKLEQNYPNPFNAGTTIGFSLAKDSDVTLSVFDILGKQVMQSIRRKFPAGRHKITLDLKNLATGTYHYKLKAGSFSETKSMLMVK